MNANETTINVATENMGIKKEKVLSEILRDYLNERYNGNLPKIFDNDTYNKNVKLAIDTDKIRMYRFNGICKHLAVTYTIELNDGICNYNKKFVFEPSDWNPSDKILEVILQDCLNETCGGRVPKNMFKKEYEVRNIEKAVKKGMLSIDKFIAVCMALNILCTITLKDITGYSKSFKIGMNNPLTLYKIINGEISEIKENN